MHHVCAARFDVMGNLEKILKLNKAIHEIAGRGEDHL